MALQNNPVAPTGNASYPSYPTTNAPVAPTGNAPAAINTVDSYSGAQQAPAAGPAPTGVSGMAAGLMGKLGIGSLIGGLGGAFVGARVLLPKLALRLAPKVPPSMWLKFGVIGGSALAGAWLVGKLFGAKTAPTDPAQQA
jgi:hypothetical protein